MNIKPLGWSHGQPETGGKQCTICTYPLMHFAWGLNTYDACQRLTHRVLFKSMKLNIILYTLKM